MGKIAELLGVIAALLAIGGAIYDIWQEPDVNSEGSDLSSPFSIPFSVKNNSTLFAMQDAALLCSPRLILAKNNSRITGEGDLAPSEVATIQPKERVNFRCQVGTTKFPTKDNIVNLSDEIQAAHIFLHVKYKTMGFNRDSAKTEFTWFTDTGSPRWIKGKIYR